MIPVFERSVVGRVFRLNDAVTRESWDSLRSATRTVSPKSAQELPGLSRSGFSVRRSIGSRPMRRLFVTDMPATLAASTCVLVFAMCFFSLGSLTRYLASRALKRQTSVLARGLREAVTGTRHELEELPPIEALNCRNGTSDV